jgi:hypothetical protein
MNVFKQICFTDRGAAAAPLESSLYFDQFTSGGSAKDVLVYIPPDSAGKTLPVTVWLHGDGGKGTATYYTGSALSGSGVGPYTAQFDNNENTVAKCVAATTANITLSGEQTIDTYAATAGDRILVKDQTDQTENGIYDVAVGAWTRSIDSDSSGELNGLKTTTTGGSTNYAKGYRQSTSSPTIGVSNIVFATYNPAREVAAGSVKVYDGATLVASGRTNGTLKAEGGSGVTGTINHMGADGAISVTFTGTPAGAVTMNYGKSVLFETSLPTILNDGDEPEDMIILFPQITATNFSATLDWDDLLTWATVEFNIDTNRQYIAGMSRGGRGGRIIFQARYTEIAACYFATLDYTGLSTDAWLTNYDNKGFWVHHGTSDTVLTPGGMLSMLNNANTVGMVTPPIGTPYWGITHSSNIWTTNTFSRSERTDLSGTSDHDWVRWIKKWSLDASQRATQFVEHAEYTQDIIEYRQAYLQVDNLTAGATKTALLARLAIVKPLADNSGVRYIIDCGTESTTLMLPETSGTNINNLTNASTSQTLSNLVAEDKSTSTIGFEVVSQMSDTGTNRVASLTNRMDHRYFGYPDTVCADGARVAVGISGEVRFTNLPAGTYDVRVLYGNNGTGFGSKSDITASINGSSKNAYAEVNGYRYFEWTGLSRDGSNYITILTSNVGGASSHIVAFELLKY